MKREIIFRGWNPGPKNWIYSDPMPDFGFWKWVAYDSTTIFHQAIGITDKNGKPLFEGDIVKVQGIKRVGEYITTIVWNKLAFELETNKTYYKDGVIISGMIEIIGNIVENSESRPNKE